MLYIVQTMDIAIRLVYVGSIGDVDLNGGYRNIPMVTTWGDSLYSEIVGGISSNTDRALRKNNFSCRDFEQVLCSSALKVSLT